MLRSLVARLTRAADPWHVLLGAALCLLASGDLEAQPQSNAPDVLVEKSLEAMETGDFAAATQVLERAIEILAERDELDGATSVGAHFHLASLYYQRGDIEKAVDVAAKAYSAGSVVHAGEPAALGAVLQTYIYMLVMSGATPGDIVPLAQDQLALLQEAHGTESPELVPALDNLASLSFLAGEDHEATEAYCRSLLRFSATAETEHPDELIRWVEMFAKTLEHLGRYEDAAKEYERGLELREERAHEMGPMYANALHDLGWIRWLQGDYEGAVPLLRRALEGRMAFEETPQELLNATRWTLASCYLSLGDVDEADSHYREVHAYQMAQEQVHPYGMAVMYRDLATIARARQKPTEAREQSAKALEWAREAWPEHGEELVLFLSDQIDDIKQDDPAETIPLYEQILTTLGSSGLATAQVFAAYGHDYADVLDGLGRSKDARVERERAQQALAAVSNQTGTRAMDEHFAAMFSIMAGLSRGRVSSQPQATIDPSYSENAHQQALEASRAAVRDYKNQMAGLLGAYGLQEAPPGMFR
ncbi:MAG: hypothetical protein DHS20C21_02830 [Gemmatimonadota bacterium]|nr:MAG: hypothetical protein DHS20C21_02830 [Gemmatimonadota bacterium]